MLNTEIIEVTTPKHMEAIRALFIEYQDFLGVDLCFQDFQAELDTLPGKYALPKGNLYLALKEGEPVGCAAFYPLESDTAEIKRVYVKPSTQGSGLGKALFERVLADAKAAGYKMVRLDSLRRLEKAYQLYLKYGFKEVAPYNVNPHPDVYYMERPL